MAIGWFIDGKFTANPFKTYAALEKDGLNLGKFGKVFAVMVKYVSPLLILAVEIFGIRDIIFPDGAFSKNGLGIVLTALALFALTIAAYFIFFKNKETGCNADETDIAAPREDKANIDG